MHSEVSTIQRDTRPDDLAAAGDLWRAAKIVAQSSLDKAEMIAAVLSILDVGMPVSAKVEVAA
jgi:hypothetical protein